MDLRKADVAIIADRCRASPGLFPSGPGKTTRKPIALGV